MKLNRSPLYGVLALVVATGCDRDISRPAAQPATLVVQGRILTGEGAPVSFARLSTEVRPLNCTDSPLLSDVRDVAGEFAVSLPAQILPSQVCVVTVVDPTPGYAISWDDIHTMRDSVTLQRDTTRIQLDVRYDFALVAGGTTLLGQTARRIDDVRFEVSGAGRTENYHGARSIDYLRFDPGTVVTVRAWYETAVESGGPVAFTWTAGADRRVGFSIMVGRGNVKDNCGMCVAADSAPIMTTGGLPSADALYITWTTPQQISHYNIF